MSKKSLLIFFSFFLYFNIALPEDLKIVYVDIDKIINESTAGKNILKQIKNINSKNTSKFNRHDICDFYEDHKVSTRTFFGGNTLLHPAYSDIIKYDEAMTKYPNSTKITTDTFILGLHPSIGPEQIEWMKNVTDKFFISKELI